MEEKEDIEKAHHSQGVEPTNSVLNDIDSQLCINHLSSWFALFQ